MNVLSRKINVANEEHYRYLQRVLKYLKGTKVAKLIYDSKENALLSRAIVMRHGHLKKTKKSTSGYMIRVFGNLIMLKSKKQSLVAFSTAEAEYIAMSEAS